jgi:2'-5' RNA ligase
MAETAIIVPVDPAEEVVRDWRREHTPSGSKGMPAHITLLAPFAPPGQLVAGRTREVSVVLAGFQPFEFELRRAVYFDLGSRRVLYLQPEPAEPFVDLINSLVASFPEHPPYGDAELRPRPHLTVATSPDDALLAQIEDAVRRELPISGRASEAWIVEYGDDGCQIRSRITLGGHDGGQR